MGEALGVLTGRQRAYGYWHVERFLTQVASADGAEVLTNTPGKWTAQMWHSALEERWQRVRRTYAKSCKESEKCARYAHEQCHLLRALEDFTANERTMYELDNRKDQIMTVCKLALANVVMWTRDHYFPTSYAQAT